MKSNEVLLSHEFLQVNYKFVLTYCKAVIYLLQYFTEYILEMTQ